MTVAHERPPNPPANGESHLHRKVLAREAAKVAADLGLRLSPARIRVLVDQYLRTGTAFPDLRTWLLSYADPTGNRAARNVDRERAR